MDFQPFIYALVDPIEPRHVRYVGMAPVSKKRPQRHAFEARRLNARITHKINWIRKIQLAGREPEIMVLEELRIGASRELLAFVERCYIKSLREIGHQLTNSTDGGEGSLNPSPETRAAMSAAHKGKQTSLGRKQPEEEKRRRGLSIAKYCAEHPRIIAPETCAKIAAALTGSKLKPETCAKIGASHLGKKRSEEACANMAQAQKGHRVSQQTRVKLAQAKIGKTHSLETRKKQSDGIKAAKGTPEARLAASIRQKAIWAKRRGDVS